MITSAFPTFFEGNDYFIDEKVGLLKFANSYKVFDAQGTQLGNITQTVPGWQKVLRIISNLKAMMPFSLDVKDMQGNTQASIKRGWTLFMSKIEILDGTGSPIGQIRQKFKFFTPTFLISDAGDNPIAKITGDWKAWNFSIEDNGGNPIGTISKKWNGFMKEAFTTADKYVVSVNEAVAEDIRKVAIVSAAITIDMVLKESK
jgi:uncharacterized protein YxjI